jgi:hypothetical protein
MEDYTSILMSRPMEGLDKAVLPGFEFKKPFKTSIINTTLNIAYSAQIKPNGKNGSFAFTLDVNESSFQAEKVVTDDVIEKYVGGIYVKVFLKGTCTGVGFHSTSPSVVQGTFDVTAEGPSLIARIENMSITGLGEWGVTVGHCDGPVGYQKALEGELKKFAKDQKAMTDMFRNQLQNKLNSMISEMTSKVMQERQIQISDKINVTLNPSGIFLNKDSGQVVVYGAATSVIESQKDELIEIPANFTEEDEKKFSQSGFILPQEYVGVLSSALFKSGIYGYDFTSQTFTDLKSLFGNRLYQFFLWRDLFKFSLGSIFHFSTYAKQEPKISALGSRDGYAWFNLSGPVNTDIQAPKNNQYIPYLTLNANANVNAWLGVFQGKALVGFQKPVITANKVWDKNYFSLFKPSDSINVGFFVKRVVDMIAKKRFVFDLPNVEVGDSQVLRPKKFVSDAQWVQLVYEPTTGN